MRKPIAILIALLLVIPLTFAACKSEPTPAPAPAPDTEPQEKQAPAPPPAPEPKPAPVPKSTTPAPETEPPELITITIDETDPAFNWTGKWETQQHESVWGGSATLSPPEGQQPAPGSEMEFTFAGTGVTLICMTAPWCGIAEVRIDGNPYQEIDMYNEETQVMVKSEIARDLPNAQHVLTLTVTDRVNPSLADDPKFNNGGVIVIDGIEVVVLPGTEQPTPEPKPTSITKIIEDTDPAFVWEGGWEVQDNPGASGGTWTVVLPPEQAATFDAKVHITFTGTEVALRYISVPHGGRLGVNIDGVDFPSIDMYSVEVELKITQIATDLDNTEHVLTLTHLNERNSLSTGYAVVVDAIEVTRPE